MSPLLDIKALVKEGNIIIDLLQNRPKAIDKKSYSICCKLNKKYRD